jgi:hypothetical protein
MRAEPHRAGEVRVVIREDARREGVGRARVNEARMPLWALGWFGWWKSRLVSADSIVFCERE